MKLFYPVIFTKEETGFSTVTPDLSGCFSEGDNFTAAYENTRDAIGLYLDGMKDFPPSSNPGDIKIDPVNQFLCIVEFDEADYKKKNHSRAIKKTLTVPEWLNDEAEAAHINFSGVLQEALKEKLHIDRV